MMVPIYVAADITEADEVQGLLAEAGIPSTLERAEGDASGPPGDGPCRILVSDDQREPALDALRADAVADDGDDDGW